MRRGRPRSDATALPLAPGGALAAEPGGVEEAARDLVRGLREPSADQERLRVLLLTLCAACGDDNPAARANRAAVRVAGGASQLVEMLVDEGTTVGRLNAKGGDAHSFTALIVQVLRDLARGGLEAADAHAEMVFVGLPQWLAQYLPAASAGRKPTNRVGRLVRGEAVAGETETLAQQLILLLSGSAAGMEGLLHAGAAEALAHEIEGAPPELAGHVFMSSSMVLKYHHEAVGAVDAANTAIAGAPGYSQLLGVAGRAVQNEIAVLLEELQGSEEAALVAAEELVRLANFSGMFVEQVNMKLLPALQASVRRDQAASVSRAASTLAVVCEGSPELAALMCGAGLLRTILTSLTPGRRLQSQMDAADPSSRSDAFVFPRTRLYLLEMLVTISVPSSSVPHSIAHSILLTATADDATDVLDVLVSAFQKEADRAEVALGPLSHFVTVLSFMVLDDGVRKLMIQNTTLIELLLEHSCINPLAVLAIVAMLDETQGGNPEVRDQCLWALRRVPTLDIPIESDPDVSVQVARALGYLVAKSEWVKHVVGCDLCPFLLEAAKSRDPNMSETRHECVAVLRAILDSQDLLWTPELVGLKQQIASAVTASGSEPPSPRTEPEDTPDGWERQTSATTGDQYYVNTATGESQWTLPAEDGRPEDRPDISSTESSEDDEELPPPAPTSPPDRSTDLDRAVGHPQKNAADVQRPQAKRSASENEEGPATVGCTQDLATLPAAIVPAAEPRPAPRDGHTTRYTIGRSTSGCDEVGLQLLFTESGPLGITFKSSRDVGGAVTVEEVRPGGVAARMGGVHVGMELRSVNGQSIADQRLDGVLQTIKRSRRPLRLGFRFFGPPSSESTQMCTDLQLLATALEQRIGDLEAKAGSVASDPADTSTGMSLRRFLEQFHLHQYESRLTQLGVAVPEHLRDVEDEDLQQMGLKKLELSRFRSAVDLLGELDDL